MVIPFRNSAQFLAEAIEPLLPSVRSGTLELILVDNGSSDGSRELVDGYALENLAITLVVCVEMGPGPARNLGIRSSKGKYIAFLDADDIVDPLGLLGVCDRIEKVGADLGIFNHCRLYPDGRLVENRRSELLSQALPAVTEEDKLALLDNFNVAWNKVYRRSLIDKFGLSFPEGIYEDIPWSISCLFAARKVVTESRVIYTYRQHPASTLKFVGKPHVVLPEQYRRAIDFCVLQGGSDQWVGALVNRAVEHGLLIAYKRKRMNWRIRVQVLSGLSSLVSKYNGFAALRQNSRITSLQKFAFKTRLVILVEVKYLLGRSFRRIKKVAF